MYYHPIRRLVFLAQPHTGSRSVARALERMGFVMGDRRLVAGEMFISRYGHHATLYKSGVVTPKNRSGWTVFSAVRNHFDLVLSRVWKFQRRGEVYTDDIDWTDKSLFERALYPTYWVKEHTLFGLHGPDSDRLLRFETLADDLAEIVGPVKLPRIGANPLRGNRPFQEFYTPETRALVEDRFGDEMKELGYSFDA